MIREIIRDPMLLSRPSAEASMDDLPAARDLHDTLSANRERCVGLAANMIGVLKNIIIFDDGGSCQVMFNPEIISASGSFSAEEGCLSLEGVRKTKRYSVIKVKYMNGDFLPRVKTFRGFTAQIIQHEIDHCRGILI